MTVNDVLRDLGITLKSIDSDACIKAGQRQGTGRDCGWQSCGLSSRAAWLAVDSCSDVDLQFLLVWITLVFLPILQTFSACDLDLSCRVGC